MDGPLNIPQIPPTPPTSQRLVCTFQISSHMPDHIDFLAFFAIHTAKAMGIPCTQHAIHLPTIWKKWNVIKSPFIFAKTKEIFEEKVYRRVIQLFDADDVAVEEWANYLVSRLPDSCTSSPSSSPKSCSSPSSSSVSLSDICIRLTRAVL